MWQYLIVEDNHYVLIGGKGEDGDELMKKKPLIWELPFANSVVGEEPWYEYGTMADTFTMGDVSEDASNEGMEYFLLEVTKPLTEEDVVEADDRKAQQWSRGILVDTNEIIPRPIQIQPITNINTDMADTKYIVCADNIVSCENVLDIVGWETTVTDMIDLWTVGSRGLQDDPDAIDLLNI